MFVVVIMFSFFFKQKTAYEMRISDWSSDVCSSDLHAGGRAPDPVLLPLQLEERHIDAFTRQDLALEVRAAGELLEWQLEDQIGRASCRDRVCHTCRSRGSPYH